MADEATYFTLYLRHNSALPIMKIIPSRRSPPYDNDASASFIKMEPLLASATTMSVRNAIHLLIIVSEYHEDDVGIAGDKNGVPHLSCESSHLLSVVSIGLKPRPSFGYFDIVNASIYFLAFVVVNIVIYLRPQIMRIHRKFY